MNKPAIQLKEGDDIDLEQDGTRVLCKVVRAPDRVWMPSGLTTFWVREKAGYELHLVSCLPDHEFELEEVAVGSATS